MPIPLLPADWTAMWVPNVPLVELVLRGTVIYLALFVYFRVMRRESGHLGVTDVLLVVLIADASQNAMSSDYKSITEGLVVVATLGFWDVALNWLSFRFRWLEKWIEPPPLLLVRDGKLQRRNMRREMITTEELMSQLRLHGEQDASNVQACYLEGNGDFSVLKRNAGRD